MFNNELPDTFEEDIVTERQSQENSVNKLMQCVQKLKKDERLLISLVLEELSYQEIADIIGIEANNVGVRINRIKNRLLKIYNNECF